MWCDLQDVVAERRAADSAELQRKHACNAAPTGNKCVIVPLLNNWNIPSGIVS